MADSYISPNVSGGYVWTGGYVWPITLGTHENHFSVKYNILEIIPKLTHMTPYNPTKSGQACLVLFGSLAESNSKKICPII